MSQVDEPVLLRNGSRIDDPMGLALRFVRQDASYHGYDEAPVRRDAYGLADRSDLLSVVEQRQLAWARTVLQGAAAGLEAYVRLEGAGAANLEDLAWLRVHKEAFTAALTA